MDGIFVQIPPLEKLLNHKKPEPRRTSPVVAPRTLRSRIGVKSENTKRTLREHSENTQRTLREHSEHKKSICCVSVSVGAVE